MFFENFFNINQIVDPVNDFKEADIMNKAIIIFGDPDLEQREAQFLAIEHGYTVATATCEGEKVNAMTAYKADGFVLENGQLNNISECIIFECSPEAASGLKILACCDHHYPGDPGYDLGPDKFWEASSLGQLSDLLDFETTYLTRVIAAADHCLADAYAGRCPGIFQDDVLQVRLPELMVRERELCGESLNCY